MKPVVSILFVIVICVVLYKTTRGNRQSSNNGNQGWMNNPAWRSLLDPLGFRWNLCLTALFTYGLGGALLWGVITFGAHQFAQEEVRMLKNEHIDHARRTIPEATKWSIKTAKSTGETGESTEVEITRWDETGSSQVLEFRIPLRDADGYRRYHIVAGEPFGSWNDDLGNVGWVSLNRFPIWKRDFIMTGERGIGSKGSREKWVESFTMMINRKPPA